MCGIAGIVDFVEPPGEELLLALSRPLERRGPDDYGAFRGGPVGLVHRRLSVIDVEGGHQPLFNEDRSLALVFNGEIYDFHLLRDELIGKGHTFATRTDSEVLLHLYEEEGPAMLRRLNGMFAFAICHLPSGELFMARDRLGQKPFFYAKGERRFAFASGPLSLAELPWVDTALDVSAIHDYLEFQYIPTPRSIYRGVKKLPPGWQATWRDGIFEAKAWWEPRVQATFTGTYAEAQVELHHRLSEAVRRRLVADVPLGMFLSGGLDSSLVTALAQARMSDRAQTFSIGFSDPRYDERAYAASVAAFLGTDHHVLEVQPDDFAHLRDLAGAYEEPFCDASMLPTSLLSRFTRKHVTVALSGDAADELFGGYYRHRVMKLAASIDRAPKAVRRALGAICDKLLPPKREERSLAGKLRRLAELVDVEGLDRYLRIISRVPSGLKESLYGEAMQTAGPLPPSLHVLAEKMPNLPGQQPIERIMQLDEVTYLNDDVLVKVDRASMAYGLEVRSPFLDVHVVEFANSLPYAWKQRGARRKLILAETFAADLPPEIPGRAKMGFGVPIATWFRGGWEAPTRELFTSGRLAADGLFRRDRLDTLLADHVAGRADHSYLLYALLVLELWLQERR